MPPFYRYLAYECFAANAASTSAVDMLAGSIFAVWATEEVLPLFEYIRTTQRTGRPLILAGFDTQISSARGVLFVDRVNPPNYVRF